MQIHLYLVLLLTGLWPSLANAQTPECPTGDTCFGRGPSKVDLARGVSIINVACTDLVGSYRPQEQRLTCAWGTTKMKFDFAVRNLDTKIRVVDMADCSNAMTNLLTVGCGSLGGRKTLDKIMFLSVNPITASSVSICDHANKIFRADPNNGQCSGFTTTSQITTSTCPASFWN